MASPTSVYLCYDARMALHRPPPGFADDDDAVVVAHGDPSVPEAAIPPCFERASRIVSLHDKMLSLERRLLARKEYCNSAYDRFHRQRFVPIAPTPCQRGTIELAHSSDHYDNMLRSRFLSDQGLRDMCVDNDLYFCKDTFDAASLSVGGVVNCVDAVLTNEETGFGPTRAIALVRPPGHHATCDAAMGFCYFNNIAVAAKHAIHEGRAERVFVLDWDIHHGNGIQDITYDDPNIFYMSIHRAAFGTSAASQRDWFYPGTGHPEEVGSGFAAGTNLNIAWETRGMGNVEYAAAFQEAVLPVVSAFRPDLILIACGLDAARGDLLGDCGLSPDMFYIMTRSVLEAGGIHTPFVVALEGGYDLETMSTCMEATALALLDEPFTEHPYAATAMRSDSARHKEQFDLLRYWDREAFEAAKKKKRKTKRALASIRKSLRALTNTVKGRCLLEGRRWITPHPVRNLITPTSSVAPIVPLCHRPVQPRQDYAFSTILEGSSMDDDDDSEPELWSVYGYSSACQRPLSNASYPFKKRKLIV
jgi:acetoin utilization deacetylase AcuC-like enzyme